jgi:hypothetical protein
LEGAAGAEEASEEGVECRKEVLAGLGLGRGQCGDGGLAVNEDVDVGEPRRAHDDVEREDGSTDLRFKDGVLTFVAQVLLPLFYDHSALHRNRGCSHSALEPQPVREDADASSRYDLLHLGACGVFVWRDARGERGLRGWNELM